MDHLNNTESELGDAFNLPDKEDFESSVTDISDFQPLVKLLISLSIIELENDARYENLPLLAVPEPGPEPENHANMGQIGQPDTSRVYFEKQGRDNLCGLHCLNSLLQGPFFDEISLSQIAQALDKEEAELLGGEM